MSIVTIDDIKFLNDPAPFTAPYELEITFKCHEALKDDLEWRLIYVGSSTSLKHDQELDSLLVGPIPVGVNKFVFTADPPSLDLIPASEVVSVTVILLTCSYADREFVRVGYYVNNEYEDEGLRDNPPSKVQIDKVIRNVLAEKPRVTYFNIEWDNGRNDLESFEQQSKLEDNAELDEEVPDDELEDDELSEEENEEEANGNEEEEDEDEDEDEEEILEDDEVEENKGTDQPDEDIDIGGDDDEPDYDANQQQETETTTNDESKAKDTNETQKQGSTPASPVKAEKETQAS